MPTVMGEAGNAITGKAITLFATAIWGGRNDLIYEHCCGGGHQKLPSPCVDDVPYPSQELGPDKHWVSESIFGVLFLMFALWTFTPFVTQRKRFYTVVMWSRLLMVLVSECLACGHGGLQASRTALRAGAPGPGRRGAVATHNCSTVPRSVPSPSHHLLLLHPAARPQLSLPGGRGVSTTRMAQALDGPCHHGRRSPNVEELRRPYFQLSHNVHAHG